MFHAARATLFQATGAAPRKHGSVISAFGRLVRDGDSALRQCGRLLNAMKDGRTEADYNEDFDSAVEDATEAAKPARDFLATCSSKFEFGPDKPPSA